jgi:hypothetical protein
VDDEFCARFGDLLTGSYDCVDRIVLNAYFSLGHSRAGSGPGGGDGTLTATRTSTTLI